MDDPAAAAPFTALPWRSFTSKLTESMFRFSLFPAFLFLAGGSRAAEFTMDSAVTYALAHNPDLAAARLGVDQAKARLLQTGGLANPELETEVRPNLAGREFSVSFGLSQKFPLTQRLRLEKAVSEAGVAMAELEIAAAARSLTTQVREIVLKLQSLHTRQQILNKQQSAARDLAAAMTKTAAAGESPPLESAQVELEVSQLAILALQGTSERASLTGSLRPLLGSPATEPIIISGTLPAPSMPAFRPDPAGHPDYLVALTKAGAARRSIELARANRWEDLTVGVAYERSHIYDAGAGMERENMAVLRFSLPLPLKRHNAGHLAESVATSERTTLEAAATAARLRAEAAAAFDEMKALAAIHLQTSTQLLPQAEALETRFTQLQQNGQAAFPDVLRARQQRLAMESAALDARRDFHLAKLRYQAAGGL